jgi:hypothetical protein
MLDVHPPHEPVHGWRDFLTHLLTITIGLLIALGLEATAEWMHHRREVAETREALHHELQVNRERFGANTGYFRQELTSLEANLTLFGYLRKHPGAPTNKLPAKPVWSSSNARMEVSAWKTTHERGISAYMPQDEVMREDELYSFYERIDQAHEEEADALAEAIGYMLQDPDPSHMTPAQLDRQIELTKRVLSLHLRHGFLMQNLAEQFDEFQPAPTRNELQDALHMTK